VLLITEYPLVNVEKVIVVSPVPVTFVKVPEEVGTPVPEQNKEV
jgi:hypothetical protein